MTTLVLEHLQHADSASPDITIDSNGNVGIGTSSPAWQLHVKGTSNAVVQIEGASSAGSFVNFGDSSDTEVGQIGYDHTSNYMRFKINAAEAMRIDASGNVGIGTSSLTTKLHVSANNSGNSTLPAGTVALFENNAASIITVRHPSDGNHFSGIAMVDNNIGGYVVHGDGTSGDGLHVKGYGYVQINTGASSTVDPNNHSRIASFSTSGLTMYKPGSNTSANIWTEDNVAGMNGGGYSPKYIWLDNLQVNNWHGGLDRGWGDYPSITIQNYTNHGPQTEFRIHGIGGVSGGDFSIVTRCDGGYATGSDSRRKTNVESVTNALDIINQLDGKRFNIVNKDLEEQNDLSMEETGKKFGFIAQDVKSIIPEAVKYYENEDTPEENGYASAYSMDYASLIPLLTNAIKEQQTIINQLKARLDSAGL